MTNEQVDDATPDIVGHSPRTGYETIQVRRDEGRYVMSFDDVASALIALCGNMVAALTNGDAPKTVGEITHLDHDTGVLFTITWKPNEETGS